MGKFKRLTQYINVFEEKTFGEWVLDREHEGTSEGPIQMPYVSYSDEAVRFIKDVYLFADENPTIKRYHEILEKYHLEDIENADVSALPAECAAALIVGAVRSERFCDGAIYDYFENGCIMRWLNRLRDCDEQ